MAGNRISIEVDNKVRVPLGCLPQDLENLLKERLIFNNLSYQRRARFGKVRRGEGPYIFCIWASEDGKDLIIPRGYTPDLIRHLHASRTRFSIVDSTRQAPPVDFPFSGRLWGYQEKALQSIETYRFGILKGGVGTGKKVISLKLVSLRKVPTLVIVKLKRQLYEWKSLAVKFMGLKDSEIGLIGDGNKQIDRDFTIAIDRSLYRFVDQLKIRIGFLIVDQCHLANIKIFFKGVLPFDCEYMLGLTSVSRRGDGLDGLMRAFLGPVRHEIIGQVFAGLGTVRPVLKIQPTKFEFDYQDNFGDMITALVEDQNRNEMIVTDILEETSDPKKRALVVSERVSHLKIIQHLLRGNYKE